jgi:NTE family protein
MENYAGRCGYTPPDWMRELLDDGIHEPRQEQAVRMFLGLTDAETKQYIHLIDGGISDNLGLRAGIDLLAAAGGMRRLQRIQHFKDPDHIAMIVVNAETDPNPTIDLTLASPSFALLMNSVSGAQIRRYNFETLLLGDQMVRRAAEELSDSGRRVTSHMVHVGFDEIDDLAERRYFKTLPTSFKLSAKQVDELRRAGRRLLRDSQDFQELVAELNR